MIVTNNYKDIIKFCRETQQNKKYVLYHISCFNDRLIISDSDSGEQLFLYNYENKEIKDLLKNIFDKNSNFFVTEMNHYQFPMQPDIFGLFLTAANLKANNIPISNTFKIRGKSGKVREITAPNDQIKPYLQNINKILQKTYDIRNDSFQVAYKRGKCVKNNAQPHTHNKYMFKIDLHNFFPSCKREYVEKYIDFLFQNANEYKYVKNLFLDLILVNNALYIGNPISGTLANVIISKPVEYIKNMCKKFGMEFSVYADDMTFSSNKFIKKEFVVSLFNKAFLTYNMENDFTLNEKKCYGLTGANRSVTGVVINHRDELTCHRKLYDGIRMTLHQLSYGDASHYNHQKLQGQIAFVSMVDESGKLNMLLIRYETIVLKYKLVSKEKMEEIKKGVAK